MAPCAGSPRSRPARAKSKASVTSPSSPRASTVAARLPSRQTLLPSPKSMRSPALSRLAGRARACQRLGVKPLDQGHRDLRACLRRARARRCSSAGITLVSLNTSASPGASRSGRSRIVRSASGRVGRWIDHQQPRRVARARRAQRDQLLRQMIVERSCALSRMHVMRTIARPSICRAYDPPSSSARAGGSSRAMTKMVGLRSITPRRRRPAPSGSCPDSGAARRALILSTFSMPSITRPHTVYCRSRKVASSKQMKNWLSARVGRLRARHRHRAARMRLFVELGA